MKCYICLSSVKLLLLTVFVAVFSLSSCTPVGQNQSVQPTSSNSALGKILTDVATTAIETQADQALGKNRGNVDHIRLMQKDNNGYLLRVSYSDVKLPQGVTLIAEAYGTAGKLPQYVSAPVPITRKQGQAQLAIYGQGGSPAEVTSILVKMVRDGDTSHWIAASSYLPGGHFQSQAAQQLAAPPVAPPAPSSVMTDQVFCNQYAEAALLQFHQAQQRHCPGINFPVWHDNKVLHYNWCLGTSRQTVNNEQAKRAAYLKTCGSN